MNKLVDNLLNSTSPYPQTAGYKREGTSADAARGIEQGRAQSLRDGVRRLFDSGWTGTADEAAARLGASILAIRPRFSELVKAGFIVETGERRRSKGGRSASVWRRV